MDYLCSRGNPGPSKANDKVISFIVVRTETSETFVMFKKKRKMFHFMTGWEAQQCRQMVLQQSQKYHLCFTGISKGTPTGPSPKTGKLIQGLNLDYLHNNAQHLLN